MEKPTLALTLFACTFGIFDVNVYYAIHQFLKLPKLKCRSSVLCVYNYSYCYIAIYKIPVHILAGTSPI